MKTSLTRREFIQTSLIGTGAFYLSAIDACSSKSQPAQAGKSRVVIARRDSVRSTNNTLNSSVVHDLLNHAVEEFFETNPAQKIWAKLFSPADTVGIKVNCLAGRGISTSIELVDAIVENLVSAGVKPDKIIIWDRANDDLEKAGYQIQTGSRKVKCYGHDYAGYTTEIYESRSIGSFLSNILVRHCTAVINVPIIKDHGIVGITNALKNFFGAIHNPNKYHSYLGNPYIADVNLLPEIRNKVRLTICDALTAQYEGGPPYMPQWSWQYNGIVVGTDMVAIDTVAWKIIEAKRTEMGFPTLKAVGREPSYIATAADSEHRLGTNDWNKIQLVKI